VLIEENAEILKDCIEVLCPEGFYKPKWDGEKWIEGLTQSEIDTLKNTVEKPTQEEILRSNLLKDNVAFKLQLAQQQKINANLLTQIAKLGGTQ